MTDPQVIVDVVTPLAAQGDCLIAQGSNGAVAIFTIPALDHALASKAIHNGSCPVAFTVDPGGKLVGEIYVDGFPAVHHHASSPWVSFEHHYPWSASYSVRTAVRTPMQRITHAIDLITVFLLFATVILAYSAKRGHLLAEDDHPTLRRRLFTGWFGITKNTFKKS